MKICASLNSGVSSPVCRLQCECQHNTCGESCDRCCPGFNQKPWRVATVDNPNECLRKCTCTMVRSVCKQSCWLLELRPPEWTEVSSCLWYLSPVVDALLWYCREPRWRVERTFLIWYVWWTAQCTTSSRITAFVCQLSQLVSRLARPAPAYQIVPHASLSASHPVSQQSRCQLESNCLDCWQISPSWKMTLWQPQKKEEDEEDSNQCTHAVEMHPNHNHKH